MSKASRSSLIFLLSPYLLVLQGACFALLFIFFWHTRTTMRFASNDPETLLMYLLLLPPPLLPAYCLSSIHPLTAKVDAHVENPASQTSQRSQVQLLLSGLQHYLIPTRSSCCSTERENRTKKNKQKRQQAVDSWREEKEGGTGIEM